MGLPCVYWLRTNALARFYAPSRAPAHGRSRRRSNLSPAQHTGNPTFFLRHSGGARARASPRHRVTAPTAPRHPCKPGPARRRHTCNPSSSLSAVSVEGTLPPAAAPRREMLSRAGTSRRRSPNVCGARRRRARTFDGGCAHAATVYLWQVAAMRAPKTTLPSGAVCSHAAALLASAVCAVVACSVRVTRADLFANHPKSYENRD